MITPGDVREELHGFPLQCISDSFIEKKITAGREWVKKTFRVSSEDREEVFIAPVDQQGRLALPDMGIKGISEIMIDGVASDVKYTLIPKTGVLHLNKNELIDGVVTVTYVVTAIDIDDQLLSLAAADVLARIAAFDGDQLSMETEGFSESYPEDGRFGKTINDYRNSAIGMLQGKMAL